MRYAGRWQRQRRAVIAFAIAEVGQAVEREVVALSYATNYGFRFTAHTYKSNVAKRNWNKQF